MSRPELPEVPTAADERTTLVAFLDFYRASLLDRAHGLDVEQLHTELAPSTLTIGRLIGHLAMVEESWFRVRFAGEQPSAIWADLDYAEDRDAEMTLAETWSRDELIAEFERSVAESRRCIDAAESLDDISPIDGQGRSWSLRWIIVHMIEEYARHCGHADLIRESIDGDTCE